MQKMLALKVGTLAFGVANLAFCATCGIGGRAVPVVARSHSHSGPLGAFRGRQKSKGRGHGDGEDDAGHPASGRRQRSTKGR